MADDDAITKGPMFLGELFTFPLVIAAAKLNRVPDEWRGFYKLNPSNGTYTLAAHIHAAMLPHVEELKELHERWQTVLTDEAKASKRAARYNKLCIDSAAARALREAGVKDALLSGAVALLSDTYKLALEGDDETVVGETEFGKCTLADAVSTFMQSDTGIAFRGERIQQPAPQHFGAQLVKH